MPSNTPATPVVTLEEALRTVHAQQDLIAEAQRDRTAALVAHAQELVSEFTDSESTKLWPGGVPPLQTMVVQSLQQFIAGSTPVQVPTPAMRPAMMQAATPTMPPAG